jgi:hypothetical protein
MTEKQYCPFCNTEVDFNPRYPNYICPSCETNPVDESGRKLEFHNVSFSGGFEARYCDTGEVHDSHICFISGVKCWADEARFGGIVIQPTED